MSKNQVVRIYSSKDSYSEVPVSTLKGESIPLKSCHDVLLLDSATKTSPFKVNLKRSGKDLSAKWLDIDGNGYEVVLTDYFNHPGQLMGLGPNGEPFVYQGGADQTDVAGLQDGAGTALELGSASATLGACKPVADGFGSTGVGLVGAGLLVVAAGAAGGGSGSVGMPEPIPMPKPTPIEPTSPSPAPSADTTAPSKVTGGFNVKGNAVLGFAEPGSIVRVVDAQGKLLGSVTADSSGRYAINLATALTNGQPVSITATDAAGNTSIPLNVNAIDTTAPVVPTATANSQGTAVAGTAEPGSTVQIRDSQGHLLGSATTDAAGVYSIALSIPINTGQQVTVTAVDPAGNVSAGLTLTSQDTTPPTAPIAAPSAAPSGYADNSGGLQSSASTAAVTDDTTPSLKIGVVPAGTTPKLYVNGVAVAAAYDAATGTLTPTAPLPEGAQQMSYAFIDAAGNESGRSPALTITIDTTAPAAPTVAPTGYADSAGAAQSATSTATVTDDTTPSLNIGMLPANTTASLYVDGVKLSATYDPATGTLTPDSPLAEGAHALTYTLADAAGNESGRSPALTITIDTTAPAAPTVAPTGYADSAGAAQSATSTATVTDDTTPSLNIGMLPADTTASLYVDGVKLSATYDPATGTLTPDSPLAEGAHALTYTLADAAGNESGFSAPLNVTIATASGGLIQSVSAISATKDQGGFNKVIDTGDVMTVEVSFSEAIFVDTNGGSPTLGIDIGGAVRQATYLSGSGTDKLQFKYTMQDTDFDHNGVAFNANALNLNGATITDSVGRNVGISHTAVAADANYRVDAIDLGAGNGLLIRSAQADGEWYMVWDRNGDGVHSTPDAGNWSTASGLEGQTLAGVQLTFAPSGHSTVIGYGRQPGTAVSDGATVNPTYDGMMAIWDAYNGAGTGTGGVGAPIGWSPWSYYWSSTPVSGSQHVRARLDNGSVINLDDFQQYSAAYRVL